MQYQSNAAEIQYSSLSSSDESCGGDVIFYEHDSLIHNYLRKQVVKSLDSISHLNVMTDKEATLKILEMNFQTWIKGLFENVYIPPVRIVV